MLSSEYCRPSAGPFHSHSVLLFAANIKTDIGKKRSKVYQMGKPSKNGTNRWVLKATIAANRSSKFPRWLIGSLVDITRQRAHWDPWKDFSFFVSTRDFSPFCSSFPLRKPNNMQQNNKNKTKAESECLARPIASRKCVGVSFTLLFFGLCFLFSSIKIELVLHSTSQFARLFRVSFRRSQVFMRSLEGNWLKCH